MDTVLLLLALLIVLYVYLTWEFDHWKKKGVKYVKPLPFFGNLLDVITLRKNFMEFSGDVYNKYSNERCVGIWVLGSPALVLIDPKLIKDVLVKDFDHFEDRTMHSDSEGDPLGCNNLFVLKNPTWKSLRSKLTHIFTSAKLRGTFRLIDNVGKDLEKYIEERLEMGEDKFELKNLSGNYTADTIATVAFGVEGRSFEKPDALFSDLGRAMFRFDTRRALEFACLMFVPKAVPVFNFKVFTPYCSNIMRKVFIQVMEERENNPVERHDLIDQLIKIKNSNLDEDGKIKLEGDTLLAQAAVFFSAGYETASSVMVFVLYELAMNESIQMKLHEEIVKVLKKDKGVLTYENMGDMSYLNMCVKESLRKYPTLPFLDRKCCKEYKLGHGLTIDSGTNVYIPTMSLHRDPRYFPEPEKYDPERFSTENAEKIKQFTYLPFGDGPRICIGQRLGSIEVKIGLIYILKNFKISICEDTTGEIVFDKKSILSKPNKDIILRFEKRKQ